MQRRSFLKLPAILAAVFIVPEALATEERPLQYVGRPSVAHVGDYYHDVGNGKIHVYNGTTWLPVAI